jgi:hypothetical protein
MTSRERFQETMRYGTPDRVPYFQEGIRKEVLEAWYRQGLARTLKLSELFPADRFEEIELDVKPKPEFKEFPSTQDRLDELYQRLNPNDPIRLPKGFHKKVGVLRAHDYVRILRVHDGFFLSMGVYGWKDFERLIYLLADEPDFVREAMMIKGEFAAKLADRVLRHVQIDAAVFSEPIGGNDGPLISPPIYEQLVLPSYKPVLDALIKNGVETIIFRTYANAKVLIPCVLKHGFNCLWACETNVEAMDYRDIRKEFGRDLRLIGGIDLDVLRYDKETIRREVEKKVPKLVADGGYVPLADGRIRKDIPFENYIYYRRLLEKVTRGKAV